MPNTLKKGTSKANEFAVISSFNLGYRNREDKTNLPPQTLITGSQNVLTNVSGRIGSRKGYTLDGDASTVIAPILSSYDWLMHTGDIRNLRAGFLTSAGNDGQLQFRTTIGTNHWVGLVTGVTSAYTVGYNFADYWDTTLNQSKLLFVNGASQITEWTGGVAQVKSATSNTLTLEGTSWAEEGFYTTGTHTVVIAGINYGATGGWGTTTLTGVAPSLQLVSVSIVGLVAHQKPEVTLNSALSGSSVPSTFKNDLIANLRNQIYLGSLTNNSVYISKVNNYKDFGFTTPTRVVGEGARVDLDGPPRALVPQEDRMYTSAGKDLWYQTKFTLSSDNAKEVFEVVPIKTAPEQATQSQGLTAKISNSVVFVSNEPIVRTLGLVENIYSTPQLTDVSNSIVNDMNSYDFTDGQVFFYKNYLYVSAPKDGTVLVYNMTNPQNPYWEAPQLLPVGRFSIIDGNLYGHSYLTSETYKLFDGYNDNGNFIDARAVFAFNNYGMRPTSKGFNQFYVEGYISSNTTLNLGLQYDLDGCSTETSFPILGTNTQIVCIGSDNNLLGKHSLGKDPLGADIATSQVNSLPPKFRMVKTFPLVPFYEYSPSFTSSGSDQQWEIIGFGSAWFPTSEGNNAITI